MNQLTTTAIVLARTNYGEADRILTLLTPDHGKLRLIAKGVRRVKSKLAGGIELFSVSTITFGRGRSEIGTLVSTRLAKHYSNIVKDLARTQAGYDFLKQLNKVTEDEPEADYFYLLEHIFDSLDTLSISLPLIRYWFAVQLLSLGGHAPNLQTDSAGKRLIAQGRYMFDFDQMCFTFAPEVGHFDANHIKLLRLAFANARPVALSNITGVAQLAEDLIPLVQTLLQHAGIS